MRITITAEVPALASHAQGLLESYCREYAHEGRSTHRKAVLYWLRGVYSAAVWGDLKHVRIVLRCDDREWP